MERIPPELSKYTPILLITTHGSMGALKNKKVAHKSINNNFDKLSIIYHYPIGVAARQTFNNKMCSGKQTLNNSKSFIRKMVPDALKELMGYNIESNMGNLSSFVHFEKLLQTVLFKNEAQKKLGINIECLESNISNNIVYNSTITHRSNKNRNRRTTINYQRKLTETRNVYNLHNVLKGEEYIEKSYAVTKDDNCNKNNNYCREFKLTLYYFKDNDGFKMIDILPEIYKEYQEMSLSYILDNVYNEINKPQSNYIYKGLNKNLIVLDMTCNITNYTADAKCMNTFCSGPPPKTRETYNLFRSAGLAPKDKNLANFVHNLKRTRNLKKPQTVTEIYNSLPYRTQARVIGLDLYTGACGRVQKRIYNTFKTVKNKVFTRQRNRNNNRTKKIKRN